MIKTCTVDLCIYLDQWQKDQKEQKLMTIKDKKERVKILKSHILQHQFLEDEQEMIEEAKQAKKRNLKHAKVWGPDYEKFKAKKLQDKLDEEKAERNKEEKKYIYDDIKYL